MRRKPVASLEDLGSVLIWLLLGCFVVFGWACVRIQFGSLGGDHGGIRLISDNETCDASDDYQHPLRGFIPAWRLVFCGICFCCGALIIVRTGRLLRSLLFYAIGILLGFAPWGKVNSHGQHYCGDKGWFHRSNIVTHKHLTPDSYCNTLSLMANTLSV